MKKICECDSIIYTNTTTSVSLISLHVFFTAQSAFKALIKYNFITYIQNFPFMIKSLNIIFLFRKKKLKLK